MAQGYDKRHISRAINFVQIYYSNLRFLIQFNLISSKKAAASFLFFLFPFFYPHTPPPPPRLLLTVEQQQILVVGILPVVVAPGTPATRGVRVTLAAPTLTIT